MTPARIASAVVALVLVIVLTGTRADVDSFPVALLPALLGAVLAVGGAWCAPLTRSAVPRGGTVLAPWRPEYEGPKTTQVVLAGLVALVVALVTQAPIVGPVLGALAAVFAGMHLRVPTRGQVADAVGAEELAAEEAATAHDDDADPDTAPVPVVDPVADPATDASSDPATDRPE